MGEIINFPEGGDEAKADGAEDSRQGVANMISMTALCEVELKYGNGSAMYAAREKNLAYHNVRHTAQVYQAANLLAGRAGVSPRNVALAGMAAAAHDYVHLGKPRGVMEQESADWLCARMAGAGMGFTQRDITTARLAVLGTTIVRATDGSYVGQQASLQEYPDEDAKLVALSVAAADMAHLYAPDGPRLSRDLYREHLGIDSLETPSLDGFLEFQEGALDLMENYRYPLEDAEQLYGLLRKVVYEYQVAVTQAVKRGHISTWEELLAADYEFEASHCIINPWQD